MHEVEVDVEQVGLAARGPVDDVVVPDLLGEGPRLAMVGSSASDRRRGDRRLDCLEY